MSVQALVGATGSGKTTALRLIFRRVRPNFKYENEDLTYFDPVVSIVSS